MKDEHLREIQEKARKYDALQLKYEKALNEIEKLEQEKGKLLKENVNLTVNYQRLWSLLDAKR